MNSGQHPGPHLVEAEEKLHVAWEDVGPPHADIVYDPSQKAGSVDCENMNSVSCEV